MSNEQESGMSEPTNGSGGEIRCWSHEIRQENCRTCQAETAQVGAATDSGEGEPAAWQRLAPGINEWVICEASDLAHYRRRGQKTRPLYVSMPVADSVDAVKVAKVRVTNGGYAMTLATYVAYALPEGDHWLYASMPSADQEGLVGELVEALAKARARGDVLADLIAVRANGAVRDDEDDCVAEWDEFSRNEAKPLLTRARQMGSEGA